MPAFAHASTWSALLPALGPEVEEVRSHEEPQVDQVRSLDKFLSSVEKRAFRIARIALKNDEDALDAVQEAMLALARRYGERPSDQWRPLFYRILQNRIRDCQRRRTVRERILAWLPGGRDEQPESDAFDSVPDSRPEPPERLQADEAMRLLEEALVILPRRQQQAFMLRVFEGLDTAQTAIAMSCSEGSVKTHYSRAVHALRERLGKAW